MRVSSIVMLLVALVFGVAAAFLAKSWLEGQTSEPRVVEQAPPASMGTIVVAAGPLRFGMQLSEGDLREIPWPVEALPKGAYAKVADAIGGKDRRVVLSAVEANEPLFEWKITGPGQRASLSALVGEGMKAVSIRVSDVQTVAGFVLPGERVDVLWTRVESRDIKDGDKPPPAFTEVLLQNIRVLAVDQLADDRVEKPTVVKSVTIEVSIEQAQKLSLAAAVGELSLVLRRAGSTLADAARRVSVGDLSSGTSAAKGEEGPSASIAVTRSMERSVYSVPRDPKSNRYSQRLIN